MPKDIKRVGTYFLVSPNRLQKKMSIFFDFVYFGLFSKRFITGAFGAVRSGDHFGNNLVVGAGTMWDMVGLDYVFR